MTGLSLTQNRPRKAIFRIALVGYLGRGIFHSVVGSFLTTPFLWGGREEAFTS